MAESAGSIVVNLDANSVKLLRELRKAQTRTKTTAERMRRSMTSAFKKIATAARVIGPALVGGFTALAAAGVKSADELAKTSTKLGIAANELAGLQFAAEQTGVKVTQLNMGLQRMVRRVAEAAQGTGEAKDAIKQLGLDARELARLSPDEQFRRIADAMQSVETQGERVRLAFKLFDSEGVALVNTLAGGSEKLKEFTDEAKKLGLALSQRQLAGIQNAADAQNRFATATKGLSQQLAAALAPAFIQAANSLAAFVTRITQALPKLIAFASRLLGVKRGLDALSMADLQAELGETTDQLNDAFDELARKQNFWGDIAGGQSDIAATEKRILDLQKRFADINNEIAKLTEELKPLPAIVTEIGDTPGQALAPIMPTADQLARLKAVKDLFQTASDSLDEFNKNQDQIAARGRSIWSRTRTDVERFAIEMSKAREALKANALPGGQETFDRFREMLLNELFPSLDELEDKTKNVTDRMAEFSKQAARNMQDAFADYLFDPFSDGLKSMLRGFIDTLRRMVANQLALQIFSFLGGLGGPLGSFFGGGKASGGPVQGGKAYLVGERGPEMLMMGAGTSGMVMPNHALVGAGPGHVFNFTTNIENNGPLDENSLVPILEENNRKVKSEFLNELQRGKYD